MMRHHLTEDVVLGTLLFELVLDDVLRNGEADRLRNGMPSGVLDLEGGPISERILEKLE